MFVTLTFDVKLADVGRSGTRNVVGWSASDKAWSKFIRQLVDPAIAGEAPAPYWVRGREPNPYRKGTHFHALIGGVPDGPGITSRRALWAWWKSRFGLARIVPYEADLGAAHYLSKYVVKELGEVKFSPQLERFRRGTGNAHRC